MYYLTTKELYHHGVLGMKWGIRRYQPYPKGKKGRFVGEKKHKEISGNVLNVEKWGKDKEHNTLYISGASGSGKSTLSKRLADSDTEVIHLDTYLEAFNGPGESQNSAFNNHLSKSVPDFKKLTKIDGFKNKEDRQKVVDAVGDEVERFSKKCYDKGKRVIVEGLQLSDDTIFPNKKYFKDKPLLVLTTDTSEAMKRATIRNLKQDVSSIDGLINKIETAIYSVEYTIRTTKVRKEGYDYVNQKLNELSDSLAMKDGKAWLNSNF